MLIINTSHQMDFAAANQETTILNEKQVFTVIIWYLYGLVGRERVQLDYAIIIFSFSESTLLQLLCTFNGY